MTLAQTDRRRLEELCGSRSMRTLMIMREGRLSVAGDPATPNNLHSIRKSLLSILIGRLVDAGRLDLDVRVVDLGIDDDRLLTETERTTTVRHLLTSSSGVYRPLADSFSGPIPAEAALGRPARDAHRPGERMVYNNWDFNVLGNIYERVSGRSLFTAFDREVAAPLGLRDWDVYEHAAYSYVNDPIGGDRRFPNFRLQLSGRDLLRIGQLMLGGGLLDGSRILSSAWVADSTRPRLATGLVGAQADYGYLWWVAGSGTALPAGSYSAFGLGGQFLTIVPEQELVLVGLIDTSQPFTELTESDRESIYAEVLDGGETSR